MEPPIRAPDVNDVAIRGAVDPALAEQRPAARCGIDRRRPVTDVTRGREHGDAASDQEATHAAHDSRAAAMVNWPVRPHDCQTAVVITGIMRKRWNDDQLRAAVADSRSIVAVCRALGLHASGSNHRHVRQRAIDLGLDMSHFVAARIGVSWTDEDLREAVAASSTLAQVIRALGLIGAGANYKTVQRRIRELGADTSHFVGQAWNRGKRIGTRPRIVLEKLLVASRPTNSHRLKTRLIREGLKQPACELCGWAQHAADGRIPLELDHINGDTDDNRMENLRILCPNCHALQPTHRGLNRKSRRR
jgi:hypothetical protein